MNKVKSKKIITFLSGVVLTASLVTTVGLHSAKLVHAEENKAKDIEDSVILKHIKNFNEVAKETKYVEFTTIDKLTEDAEKYSTTVEQIQQNNNTVDYREFKKGDKLVIGGDVFQDLKQEFKDKITNFEVERKARLEKEEKERIAKEQEALRQEQLRLEAEAKEKAEKEEAQRLEEEKAKEEAEKVAQQEAQVVNTQPVQESSTSSTYVGDSNSAKEWIAQKESSGSYTATNGQYIGRYQLTSSYLNGDYSPENQERVADQYVADRYGSWENAQQFWINNGWY